MKRLVLVAAAFVIVTVAAIGPASAVGLSSPKDRFDLSVDKKVLYSGQRFTVTATAGVVCGWALTWNGDTRAATGKKALAATYRAPVVTKLTRLPLRGTCFYAPSSKERAGAKAAAGRATGSTQQLLVTIPPSWRRTIMITVLPAGSGVSPPESPGPGPGGAGDLPNTGGPSLAVLLLGFVAVALGAAGVRTSRRPSARNDLP